MSGTLNLVAAGGEEPAPPPTLTLSPDLIDTGTISSHSWSNPTLTPSGFTPTDWQWTWGGSNGTWSWSMSDPTGPSPGLGVGGVNVGETAARTVYCTCNGVVSNSIAVSYERTA